ncbi:hypothetical protein [Microbacterium sp. P5_E9]
MRKALLKGIVRRTLNDEELEATDRYEVADYVCRVVVLASGVEAFVYVDDDD